jgi:signal transduction histidine kinase/ActR/RegA family two-component response regulator
VRLEDSSSFLGGEPSARPASDARPASTEIFPPYPPALMTCLGLMRASPMPMVLWWGDALAPLCNDAFSRLLGPSATPLEPQAWGPQWSVIAPNITRVRATGQTVWHDNAYLPLPHTPQSEFRGTYSYNPVLDADGVAGVLFICARHYRASAVQSDGRYGYAAVIHSMDVGFAIVEALDTPPDQLLDYWFVEINEAWAQQTGARPTQGKRVTELVDQREPFWPQTIASVARTGVSIRSTVESKIYGRTLDVFAMRLGGPDSRQVALLARDVTTQTRALLALQRSEQRARAEAERAEDERRRLDAMLEATPLAVIMTDRRERFVRANSRARQEWGQNIPSDSQLWLGWWADGSARHGQRLEPEDWPLMRALRGKSSREIIEIASPHDPNRRKIFVVSGAPIRSEGNRLQGVVVAAMEITDRVRAEQALQEAHQRKDEFLAMLAHELRNPLAPIGAAAELMGRPHAGKDLMKRTSAIISRQVRHMTGLVDDLLDMSRVSRGAITLDMEFLDTISVMNDAVEQVTPMLRAKRHRLELIPTPQPVLFEGDRKRVIQVLSNLLNNAIKYTPDGGQIRLSLAQTDDGLDIRVLDNGQGMDANTLAHAFELFTQARRTSDRQQGGLGIGLALVKKLVELHGGEVSATSPGPGQGSEFMVRLPTSRGRQPAARREASAVQAPAAGMKVMLVDDHVDAATTLAMLIEAEGYPCAVAHQPLLALETARTQPPDAFILDIGLPGMDGRELARRLRAEPACAQALLIALSGYAQPEDRTAAFNAGFDHYLVKPVDTQHLLALLAERGQQMQSQRQSA